MLSNDEYQRRGLMFAFAKLLSANKLRIALSEYQEIIQFLAYFVNFYMINKLIRDVARITFFAEECLYTRIYAYQICNKIY